MTTAKWIWDRSIYSIIKPSIDMKLFQYFWRFAQICKKFAAFERKMVFLMVSEQFYYRNSNKNHFEFICCKFLANLQKYWNNMMSNDGLIIEIYGYVSYSFSCILQVLWWNENNHEWNRWRKFLGNRGFPIQIGHLWKEYQNIYEKSNRLCIKYCWSTEGH